MTGTAAFPGAPTEKCEQRIHPPIEALAVARDKVRTSFVGAAHEPEAVEDELRREPAAAWVSIKNLREWKDNPRKNDPAVAAVAESIKRFGFGAPIIARLADGEVIAGHTRLKAAIKLGLSEVPVRYLDLDPADAHLLALADNKTSEICGAVRALHPWTAAISMPPLSIFLFPARPIRIYKQTHADSLLARANFGPTNGVHFREGWVLRHGSAAPLGYWGKDNLGDPAKTQFTCQDSVVVNVSRDGN